MAQYSNYKKVSGGGLPSGSIPATALNTTGLDTWNVKWFWGSPNECTPGCCCLWTVPTGVKRAHIEMWGAGGSGTGACSCSRCHVYRGAQGGYYNSKMIDVSEGWTYTVCAGGVYTCRNRECCGCQGCSSFTNGCNLTNFCAIGGHGGIACNSWSLGCNSYMPCCLGPATNGGDFGMGNHMGAMWNPKGFFCHCHGKYSMPTSAPFIGTQVQVQQQFCWIRCGCWTVPYGHGGQNAQTNYCGSSCCGQGGMGGSGLVEITYV